MNENSIEGTEYPDGERASDIWLGSPQGPSYRTSRLTSYQKRRIRDHLLKRDGNRCGMCKKAMSQQDSWIHHRDHDSTNHYAHNLELMHSRCNRAEVAIWRSGGMYTHVRERPSTFIAGIDVSDSNLDPVQINRVKEPLFRKFLFTQIKEDKEKGRTYLSKGHTFTTRSKRDYVLSGCQYTGSSEATGYRYIAKMVSPGSPNLRDRHRPLLVMKDYDSGNEYLGFSDSNDYELTIPELMGKYPVTGMLSSTDKEIREFLPSFMGER